jgi:DNA-binding transcriptional ArsR family regulator
MRKISLLAFALALLLPLANADYTAYFSPDSSAFTLSVENASMAGHFGNYTLFIQVFPLPAYVSVSGEGASRQALASEIGWLLQNRVLETSCNYTLAYSLSYQDYYCGPAGSWQDCAQSAECTAVPLPKAPADAQLPEMFGHQAADARAMKTASVSELGTGGEAKNGAGAGSQVSLEQLLQLVGAFILVIVASYLILQQRQPAPDAAEERLLANETRAGILEELSVADKIPTDLSNKLGKSKATIVEHLETLLSAGFVEKIAEPGKKFVFYRLTRKGKQALLRRAA